MVEKWMASAGYGRLGGTGREGAGWGKGSCQTPTLEGSGMLPNTACVSLWLMGRIYGLCPLPLGSHGENRDSHQGE